MKIQILNKKKFKNEIVELLQSTGMKYVSKAIYIGAWDGDELVGISAVQCAFGHWYFRQAVVKPEHRNNGIQSKLMQFMKDFVKEKGASRAWALIAPDNTYSQQASFAVGFKKVGKKKYNGELLERFVLEL